MFLLAAHARAHTHSKIESPPKRIPSCVFPLQDPKPRRIVCVDEADVVAADRAHPRVPFAFEIKPRRSKGELLLAAESAEDRARWMAAITNADYGRMYDRTRDAVVFLQNCTRAVAPFAAAREGIAVPPSELSVTARSGSGVGTTTEPDLRGYEAYVALRGRLTGSDVLSLLAAMQRELSAGKSAQREAAAGGGGSSAASDAEIASLRRAIAQVQDERDLLERQLKQADDILAMPTADVHELEAVEGKVLSYARLLDEQKASNASLSSQNAALTQQITDLKRELSALTASAARAARAVAAASNSNSARMATQAGVSEEETEKLRARVKELESALEKSAARLAVSPPPSFDALHGSGRNIFSSGYEGASGTTSAPSVLPTAGSSDHSVQRVGSGPALPRSHSSASANSGKAPPGSGGSALTSPPPSSGTTGYASIPTSNTTMMMMSPGDGSALTTGHSQVGPGSVMPLGSSASRGGGMVMPSVGVGSPEIMWEHEWLPFYNEAQRLERENE